MNKINFLISDSAFLKDRGVFNKVIGNKVHGKCSRVLCRGENS